MTGGIPVSKRRGAIATPHYLATKAGERAYELGGSAVDAVLAAAAVLAVVYPHNTGLGGDSVSLVRTPDGSTVCINATGPAPQAVSLQQLSSKYGATMPALGADTFTVPGMVRGWQTLRSYGARLGWEQQLSAAREYAENGAPVSSSLAAALVRLDAVLRVDPGLSDIFFPQGRPLIAGDVFYQKALGRTLSILSAGGPDAMYEGEITRRLTAGLKERGGALSEEDFAEFTPEITPPTTAQVFGKTILTSPPNTQGIILLRILAAIESVGLTDPLGDDAGRVAALLDASNTLRDTYLGDPKFSPMADSPLWTAPLVPSPSTQTRVADPRVPHGDTVGIVAVDSDGYAVSHVQSLFHHFGAAILEPSTGIILQNRAASFSLSADSPNSFAPRKRPSHTLMPVMAVADGTLRFVDACMGGRGQAQVHTHLLLRQLAGQSAAETVGAPRFAVGPIQAHETGNTIHVEEDAPDNVLAALKGTGMPVEVVPRHTEMLGHANVIGIHSDGAFDAASDPRSDGSAAILDRPEQ
jgi:gamma-glutamyltranspeptidase/glutathione hydrolase